MLNSVFRKSCCLRENVAKYGIARQATDYNIKRRVGFTWWIPKATNTHSECVITIAFPLQQWLNERASVLRYTYNACLVSVSCSIQQPFTSQKPPTLWQFNFLFWILFLWNISKNRDVKWSIKLVIYWRNSIWECALHLCVSRRALFEGSNKMLGFKRTCPLLITANNYLPKESPPWRYYRSCSYNNVKKKVP
jgi:hypothetical protein